MHGCHRCRELSGHWYHTNFQVASCNNCKLIVTWWMQCAPPKSEKEWNQLGALRPPDRDCQQTESSYCEYLQSGGCVVVPKLFVCFVCIDNWGRPLPCCSGFWSSSCSWNVLSFWPGSAHMRKAWNFPLLFVCVAIVFRTSPIVFRGKHKKH